MVIGHDNSLFVNNISRRCTDMGIQKQIIASQYELYLPTEQQLLEEVNKELDSFEGKEENNIKNQGLSMDTADLSIPTYNGIIIECERYHYDLTLQFGVLASDCKDDDDYLNKAEAMINEYLADDDFDVIADEIFFGESVDLDAFRTMLEKLLVNISEIRKTPMNEREYEEW